MKSFWRAFRRNRLAVIGGIIVVVLAVAAVAAGSIAVEIVVAVALKAGGGLSTSARLRDGFGSPTAIGRLFLSDHLLAFEITSVVLLVAAVGGVILGGQAQSEASIGDGDARP